MRRATKDKAGVLPEMYVTRGLLKPEQLKDVHESVERGLGGAAILFSPDEIQIPLFKISALPSFGKITSRHAFNELAAEIAEEVVAVDPVVEVPVYRNALPTLFVVNGGEDLGLRLRNSYPKLLEDNQAESEEDETVHELFEGGQIDYMVHSAVQAVRGVFPQDPIGPDHRGYINGRDRRMRTCEIYDYVKLGFLDEDFLYENPFDRKILKENPETYLSDNGIGVVYPEKLVFGAMQISIRTRGKHMARMEIAS